MKISSNYTYALSNQTNAVQSSAGKDSSSSFVAKIGAYFFGTTTAPKHISSSLGKLNHISSSLDTLKHISSSL